ncbi:MAG: FAD-dependent monooxygenase [Actinomycetales bacterium]|nr:FAD-dependent monooxygenase [Actinomycetales bacterium]
MTENDDTVLIVGGGPAGMAAAIALSRAGLRCEIVELAPDARPGGVGIALQSAPLRATMALGLYDRILAVGRPHRTIDMVRADGTPVAELPQVNVNGPEDPPFVGMARETLHELMADEVHRLGVPVRLGTTIAASTPADDHVDVELTDGTRGRWSWIVAADGLHSTTRARLLPGAPDPQYSGQSIWRAEAACPERLEHYTMMIGGPLRLGLVPLPGGRLYLWLLDALVGPERPPRDRMLGMFLERLAAFGGFAPEIAAGFDDVAQVDFRALQWLVVPPPWHAGRTLLIGDAVHGTTPHLAYGAGLALEDAVVLGELAGQGLAFEELAARLAERRFARARRIVEASLQLSRWEQEPGPPNPEAGALTAATMASTAEPI